MSTALITGASRGIGRAIAKRFAREGYDLVLNCIQSVPALEELAEGLGKQYHVRCLVCQGNVGRFEDVCRLFEAIERLSGGLDVVVNNAGISYVGLLSEMSPEDWHRTMAVNLDSCFYTSKLAIPLMLQNHRGRIINISSVWGNVGASMETAYSASKGGINAFTRALAKELAPSNIQVNAIACGCIDTDMNGHLSEEELETLREEIPADRLGTPEEVAELALQLAQAPDYLTGQVVTLDGGWY